MNQTETEHELPPNWHWGIGETGEQYADYWAYSDDGRWEAHMYTDPGQPWTVEFIEILGYDENDDPEFDYPSHVGRFSDEEVAEEYLLEKVKKLR